jgi:putative transposase
VTIAVVDEAVRAGARLESACKEVGIDVRTIQRWRCDPDGEDRRRGARGRPGNALGPEEEQALVDLLTSPEFVDLSPNQVVPKLADMNIYKASERTMYRVLRKRKLLGHRGRSLPRTRRRPPERRATGPRQAWSWDITYLRSPVRGMFWMLYMVVDVWSRKVVAARVHDRESDELAAGLLAAAFHREGVRPGELAVHADNGAAMRGQTLLVKLRDLGVTSTFSRPHTSDDNPFSEALFRTMKYRPDYPADRPFLTLEAAQAWVDQFIRWYNHDHQHSGIRFVTPAERHDGREVAILENRRRVYQAARAQAPRRWSRQTRNWTPVPVVCLNPHMRPSRPAPAVHTRDPGGERRADQGRRSAAAEPARESLRRPSTPRQSPLPTAATT